MSPFTLGGPTVSISATTNSASADLKGAGTIRVYNAGPATVFVRTAKDTATAVATDTPIPAGAIETFSVSPSHNKIAAITSAGTATVYVTEGTGI